eukprot:gene19383-38696_t
MSAARGHVPQVRVPQTSSSIRGHVPSVHVPAPSALQLQRAEEVALAERHAVGAQYVVGGRGVEVEVRQRERQQEALGGERHLRRAELECHVLAGQ